VRPAARGQGDCAPGVVELSRREAKCADHAALLGVLGPTLAVQLASLLAVGAGLIQPVLPRGALVFQAVGAE